MHAFLIVTSMVLSLFGFAGGGGSSSGGFGGGGGSSSGGFGGGGGSSWSSDHSSGHRKLTKEEAQIKNMVGMASSLVVLIFISGYVLYEKKKEKNPHKTPLSHSDIASMSAALEMVDHNDTAQEKLLHEEAKKIFVDYQNDWSTFNYDAIQNYTTDKYFQHACLMLELL